MRREGGKEGGDEEEGESRGTFSPVPFAQGVNRGHDAAEEMSYVQQCEADSINVRFLIVRTGKDWDENIELGHNRCSFLHLHRCEFKSWGFFGTLIKVHAPLSTHKILINGY